MSKRNYPDKPSAYKTGADSANAFRDWNRDVGPGEANVQAARERRAWQHEHGPGKTPRKER